MRSKLLTAVLLGGLSTALWGAPAAVPALTLTLDGTVQWLDGGHWKPVELGQLFGPGDQLRTGAGGTLLLALDDARSLALDPDTRVRLGRTGLDLRAGRLDLLSSPAPGAPGFPVHTPNALVQVQGADVEISASRDNSAVTVSRGRALLGDPLGRVRGIVAARQRRRLALGRLWPRENLAKREIFALDTHWGRARLFHAQRQALRPALLASPDHARFLRALKRRLARR